MGTILGLLLLVAMCIAVWAVQSGIGKAVDAVDKAVRPASFAAGAAEAHTALSIDAPAAPADLLARIVTSANPFPTPPAIVPGLYIKTRSNDLAQFGYGSTARGDLFDAAVRLRPTHTGCSGTYEILHWQESGADVLGRREMERLRGRVEGAVQAAHGSTAARHA